MTPTPEVQKRLRQYLLGQLAEAAREEIEKDLLVSTELFEELQVTEDELTDQYLAGNLSRDERTDFERNFLITAERQDKLKFGRAFKRYVSALVPAQAFADSRPSPGGWVRARSLFSSRYAIAAFTLFLIVIAFGVWRFTFYKSDLDKGLLALNDAYREQRPVESRISSLSYAPYPKTRGPNDPGRFDEVARTRAEAILGNAFNERPDDKTRHALGQVFLAKRQFDLAIQQFDAAVKAGSNNPKLFSDLGAAWLEKGKLDQAGTEPGKGTFDRAQALANLNKALELDGKLLDARFNRALCLQLMQLPDPAAAEWREYLKLDSTSLWAEEARRNLKQLEERNGARSKRNPFEEFLKAYQSGDDESAWLLISRNRDLSGGPIANALIDKYLAADAASEESAKAHKALSYVATIETKRSGDRFVGDLAEQLSALSLSQRAEMSDARRLLKQGQEELWQSQPGAGELLAEAKTRFARLGVKSEAIYAQYPLGFFFLNQKKTDEALAAFAEVVRTTRAQQYRWLLAQALNATANTQINLTNHSAALAASEASLKLSREIGDTTGVIKTTNQLASEYSRLGNYSKALDLHEQSLSAAFLTPPEPIQWWRNYFGIAKSLESLGLHAAAIEYEKEAVKRAEALKFATEISRSYSILGLMYANNGDFQDAARNGEAALKTARTIPGERFRQEAVAYSMLQLGLIYRQSGDQKKAITNYDQAIQSYHSLDRFEAFSYVLHKGKLLACLKTPGCDYAAEEIKTCLDLFKRYRANIREVSNRLPFFDTEQDIYDIATDYEFAKQNYQTAFEYSEQARASSLRDLAEKKGKQIDGESGPDIRLDAVSPQKSFDEIQSALSANVQVVQYTVLPDKIIIWLISDTDFIHELQSIPLAQLNETLSRYLKLVSSPTAQRADVDRDGAALYNLLLRPIEKRLKPDKLLCIVPDKMLNYLPFAALVPQPGKYLVNDYRLLRAPSSSMFIASSQNAVKKEKVASESLLAVGNPRFDHEEFPNLDDLPSAAKEARAVWALYEPPRAVVLTDTQPTKPLVAERMKKVDVLHFALHSIVDEQSPWRSRLILARSGGNSLSGYESVLEANEIYAMELSQTRLVVLSACETGVGRYYGGEGTIGLSSAFIAAGVPLVIDSLWPIDSDSTTELMIAFHRHRKTGKLSTVEALRQAQEDMLNNADTRYREPYYWAGFELTGGYATF